MNERFMTLTIVTDNVELSKRMNIIQSEMNGVLKSANKIGKALSEIRAQELWKDTYNSFEECAGIFGIKKAQAYNLIKGYEIGEKALIRKCNASGETLSADKLCTQFSNTQCVEIAKLKEDVKILDMLDKGKIKPDMSTKQLRDVIDHELHPEKFEKVEEGEEVEEIEEVETPFAKDKDKENIAYIYAYNGKIYCQLWDGKECLTMKNIEMAAKDYDKIMQVLGKYQA